MRVLCAGHVNWDVTLQVDSLPEPDGEAAIDEQSHAGGGSASNTAVTMVGLGVEVLLLGSVGRDEYGDYARQELTAAGVDCTHLQQANGETTVKYLIVDGHGEVMVLANDGVNESFRAADVPDSVFQAVDHLHLTSQRLESAELLAERARRHEPLVREQDYPGMGAHRASVAIHDEAVMIHLQLEEQSGVVITLDTGVAQNLSEFVAACERVLSPPQRRQ